MYSHNILSAVEESMKVYDSGHAYIGIIEGVHVGVPMLASRDVDIDTKADTIYNVLGQYIPFSQALITRLFHEGFVYARGGLLQRDIIILPKQIDQLAHNAIFINVKLVHRKAIKTSRNMARTSAY